MMLHEREDLINQLELDKMELKEQLVASNMDGERASMAMLTKALQEKDRQIENLQSRVKTCADDMDSNAALMEDVHSTLAKGNVYVSEFWDGRHQIWNQI